MSLPSYLANIKSPGVYRFVFDKSVVPESQRDSIRLLVGYSEKGPFNTPVYIASATDFINTFGNISRRMERKGIFFHRMCLQALQAGPILAMNLKPFNSTGIKEKTDLITFNASDIKGQIFHKFAAQVATTQQGYRDQPLVSVYDTNRFWKVDAERLHDINMLTSTDTGANAEADIVTYKNDYIRIVQTSSKDDSCTVFIRPYSPSGYNVKVSDWYSSEVSEDMPPYMEVIKDHYLNEYFAEVYVFKGNLNNNELYSYKGTLGNNLPVTFNYLTKSNGDVICWDTARTKPVLKSITAYNAEQLPTEYFILDPATVTDALVDAFDIAKAWTAPTTLYVKGTDTQPSWLEKMGLTDADALSNITHNTTTGTDGSTAISGYTPTTADEHYLSWQPFCKTDGTTLKTNANYIDIYGSPDDPLAAMADVSTSNFIGRYRGILFPGFKDATGSFISLDTVFNADYNQHKMLMHMDENLLDAATDYDENNNYVYDGTETKPNPDNIVVNSPASYVHALCSPIAPTATGDGDKYTDYTITDYDPAGKMINGTYIRGYIYTSIKRGDSGRKLIDNLYKVLSYKGIHEALTNNVDVDYHYLIDTFQAYPGLSMKSQFTQIAKAKDNCLALLNFPPMDAIMKHCGYSKYDGGFDMKEITKADNGISLPTETLGASWAAYYTQLTMSDGSSKFVVPSTALVSNLFIDKLNKRLPYYIVAGPNYGMITQQNVIGPDYNYDRADMDVLNTIGVNCIIHIPRYGIVINGNQTAKQTPVSALSKIHIRELVIFIQDEIEDMLRGYQWELNTSTLRDKIKAKADTILSLIQANGGVYAFRNTCDSTNNTTEVIDNDMVILDIEIEPARGTEKCVQTLTIYRTGGIASASKNG